MQNNDIILVKDSKGILVDGVRHHTDTLNNRSRKISFRLSLETCAKIEQALKCPANSNSSINDYCKTVVERHAFRHDLRKYRRKY